MFKKEPGDVPMGPSCTLPGRWTPCSGLPAVSQKPAPLRSIQAFLVTLLFGGQAVLFCTNSGVLHAAHLDGMVQTL